MTFSALFILGLCAHLFVDWFLQNDWQATHKTSLKHPAAYVHSGLHLGAVLFIFPWFVALGIAITHLLIDTRRPLIWWRTLIGQTQVVWEDEPASEYTPNFVPPQYMNVSRGQFMRNSAALAVAFWQDQVAHILVILAASAFVSHLV